MGGWREHRARWLAAAALAALGVGGIVRVVAGPVAGDVVWAATTGIVMLPLAWSVTAALRRGDFGVDLIAIVAMAGALATGD